MVETFKNFCYLFLVIFCFYYLYDGYFKDKDIEKIEDHSIVGSLGEPIQVGDVELTINSYEYVDEDAGDKVGRIPTSEEAQFLLIDATVKNIGKEEIKVTRSDFKAIKSNGMLFDSKSIYTLDGFIGIESINPTLAITGKLVFEVPKGEYDFNIQVQTDYRRKNRALIILEE